MVTKEIEKKSKSVIIDGEVHDRLKKYCKGRSLKIGGVIEELAEFLLINPKEVRKIIEDYKEKNGK